MVLNRITQRILQTTGSVDVLNPPAKDIIRVGNFPTSTDYLSPNDYSLDIDGNIQWVSTGSGTKPVSSYYVTYDYEETSGIKDFSTIKTDMLTTIKTLDPIADISDGEILSDLIVEVPARRIADLHALADRIHSLQTLQSPEQFTIDELNAFGESFGVVRDPGTQSTGFALFSSDNPVPLPNAVSIPVGAKISTIATSTVPFLIFQTIEAGVINPGDSSVVIRIQCTNIGAAGNVSAGTIVNLQSPLSGIAAVQNTTAMVGGTDQESNTSYAQRIIQSFTSVNIGTAPGITNLMIHEPDVKDLYLAGPQDPLMTRDLGVGGKLDIWVLVESNLEASATETVSITIGSPYTPATNHPILGLDPGYTGPFGGILTFNPDASTQTGFGVQALDNFSASIASGSYTFTYTYAKRIRELQDIIDLPENHIVTMDTLVKLARQRTVDVMTQVKAKPNFAIANVLSSVKTNVSAFVNTLGLGKGILFSDIVNVIHDTNGVLDVKIPSTNINIDGGSWVQTDITIPNNQYARVATLNNITEWI